MKAEKSSQDIQGGEERGKENSEGGLRYVIEMFYNNM